MKLKKFKHFTKKSEKVLKNINKNFKKIISIPFYSPNIVKLNIHIINYFQKQLNTTLKLNGYSLLYYPLFV